MPQVKAIESRRTTYKGWKALEVRSGDMTLLITPEIGGRVMGCLYKGKQLFYTMPQYEGWIAPKSLDTLAAVEAEKRRQGFQVYGGYKTWLSRQDDWPQAMPYFDLDCGTYALEEERVPGGLRVTLTSPVCRESGVQLTKEIGFSVDGPFTTFVHGMKNHSSKAVQYGFWDVTQIPRPGKAYIPVNTQSRFTSGIKIFDAENSDHEAVLKHVERREDFAVVDFSTDVKFKVGTDSDEGWVLGFVPREGGGWMIFKSTFEVFSKTRFGHDCSAEIFNSDLYGHFELETHSPFTRLQPGHRFTWMGHWSFGETDDLPKSRKEINELLVRM